MIEKILNKIRPKAQWYMTGNDYDSLVWIDKEQVKPTFKEIEDEIVKIKDLNRIQEIESKCNKVIEAVYPIYKQINITNLLTPYTEEDKDVMKAFIDSKRAICHQAIADGMQPEDIYWGNQ